MPRYFLELSYKGTRYSGFQIQENAPTIQWEVEKSLKILLREAIACTGSSRTDAGVHAICNFFHFDTDVEIPEALVYRLNAILPPDIAVRSLRRMHPQAHCRFDAVSRTYRYVLYSRKDPFADDRGWFYPYPLDASVLATVAGIVMDTADFTSFSKRNTQVRTFICSIRESRWEQSEAGWVYHVRGNRFLRGMVRGLVGTMLQAGRGKMGVAAFRNIITSMDNRNVDFTPPGRGLFLMDVGFEDGYFGPVTDALQEA